MSFVVLYSITRISLHLMLFPFSTIFLIIFFSFTLLLVTFNIVTGSQFTELCGFSGSLPLFFCHTPLLNIVMWLVEINSWWWWWWWWYQ